MKLLNVKEVFKTDKHGKRYSENHIYVEMTETEYLNFMAMIKRNEGK